MKLYDEAEGDGEVHSLPLLRNPRPTSKIAVVLSMVSNQTKSAVNTRVHLLNNNNEVSTVFSLSQQPWNPDFAKNLYAIIRYVVHCLARLIPRCSNYAVIIHDGPCKSRCFHLN